MAAQNRFALIAWPLYVAYHLLTSAILSVTGGLGPTALLSLEESFRALVIGGVAVFAATFAESRAFRSGLLVLVPGLLGPLFWLATALLRHLGPRFPIATTLLFVTLEWLVIGIAVALTMRLVPDQDRPKTTAGRS